MTSFRLNLEEFLQEEAAADAEEDVDMKKDLLLFNFMKNSLEEFYRNEHYDSRFITEAVVLDTYQGSKSLSKYLKDELFIDNRIEPIDLAEISCKLSYLESKE